MFSVYILQSLKSGKYYVGHTKDLPNRVNEHNVGECNSTRHGVPWHVIHVEGYATRGEAMKQEARIKRRGIKRYLESA